MNVRLLDNLKKLIDPAGPVGQWLSPSEVYKDRLGLPISSPHTIRAVLAAPADVERTFAPSRFVSLQDAADVPKSRIRQIDAYTEEFWKPVYAKTASTDVAEILRISQQHVGWTVTQQQTKASRARPSAEEVIEIAQSCQIQASDEIYNGYFETIPGNDPIWIDGKKLTGGTRITGGRREYREKTKGFIHWDAGYVKERNAALAELDSRPARNAKANLERVAGECLPMKRLLANGRYDRRSAC
jgi:hypothetical protein